MSTLTLDDVDDANDYRCEPEDLSWRPRCSPEAANPLTNMRVTRLECTQNESVYALTLVNTDVHRSDLHRETKSAPVTRAYLHGSFRGDDSPALARANMQPTEHETKKYYDPEGDSTSPRCGTCKGIVQHIFAYPIKLGKRDQPICSCAHADLTIVYLFKCTSQSNLDQ